MWPQTKKAESVEPNINYNASKAKKSSELTDDLHLRIGGGGGEEWCIGRDFAGKVAG